MRPLQRRQSMWSRPFRRLLRTPWPRFTIIRQVPKVWNTHWCDCCRRLKTPFLTSLTLCGPVSRSVPRTAVPASPGHLRGFYTTHDTINCVAYQAGLAHKLTQLVWNHLQPGRMKGQLSAKFLVWMKQIVITLPLVCDIRRSLIIYSLRKNYDFMYASDDVQELEKIQVFASIMHRWKAHVRGLCRLLEMVTCFEKS